MSVDGTELLFESFLQKRKDTVKMRWVTYWFRLQNTTLFFYTKKNGSASSLRGFYYIYTVQSVREVQKADRKRFIFEITMTNGKKKVLAAETEDLRKEWVGYLWQAMHLSASTTSVSEDAQLDVCEQRERLHSMAPICSHRESVMEELPIRPLSAPPPSDYIYAQPHKICPRTKDTLQPKDTWQPKETSQPQNTWQPKETSQPQNTWQPKDTWQPKETSQPQNTWQPIEQDNEEDIYQNTGKAYQNRNDDCPSDPQWSSQMSSAEAGQEGHYDVLPIRNRLCKANRSAEAEEDVYDVPASYRQTAECHESVYDVPSSLLRTMCDHTIDDQPEEGTYWNI
ncbi:uncharacterized protein LOC120746877 [Simochromis diagramma]|uniref:uncharacterized protein LOC120746877 n=1 Tax=Simochromis diagramma TaxID=43689 RepID=UPI001A7E2B7B|nr:uncharacterized protein LOC120746877 [Simochromis diagramma]